MIIDISKGAWATLIYQAGGKKKKKWGSNLLSGNHPAAARVEQSRWNENRAVWRKVLYPFGKAKQRLQSHFLFLLFHWLLKLTNHAAIVPVVSVFILIICPSNSVQWARWTKSGYIMWARSLSICLRAQFKSELLFLFFFPSLASVFKSVQGNVTTDFKAAKTLAAIPSRSARRH